MGCLISFALLALLFVTTFGRSFSCEIKNNTNYCSGEAEKWTEDSRRNTETLENDARVQEALSKMSSKEGEIQQVLEEILRSILKNGIPDFGVPPLDPFVYNDIISISDYDMSGIMTVEHLELGDFEIRGLSSFIAHILTLDMSSFSFVFNLTFPIEAQVNHTDINIIMGDLIPFYGDGTAKLTADLRLQGFIVPATTEDYVVYVGTLVADIFFDSLKVEISNLMNITGGKQAYIFNNLIGDITPELIDLMKPFMLDGIIDSIRDTLNDALIPLGITLLDLVNCFLYPENCPFLIP